MSQETDSDHIEEMLDACERAAELDDQDSAATPIQCTYTAWERSFLESVREQFDDRGSLSGRQLAILQELYDKS